MISFQPFSGSPGPELPFFRLDRAAGQFGHLAGQAAQGRVVGAAHLKVTGCQAGLRGDHVTGLIDGFVRLFFKSYHFFTRY
jgi:hypothetical protein